MRWMSSIAIYAAGEQRSLRVQLVIMELGSFREDVKVAKLMREPRGAERQSRVDRRVLQPYDAWPIAADM